MSNRHIEPTKILPDTAVAAGNTYTSAVLDMRTISRGAVEIDYSAGFTSSFFLQASVSKGATTFVNLTVNLPAAANIAGTSSLDLSIFGFPYYRIQAQVTAGAGTLTIWASAKGQ